MSPEPMLERSVLERKERDELVAIADAMGLRPGSRTKKSDLVDGILRAAGIPVDGDPAPAGAAGDEPAGDAPEKPKRAPRARKAAATTAEAEPGEEAVGGDEQGSTAPATDGTGDTGPAAGDDRPAPDADNGSGDGEVAAPAARDRFGADRGRQGGFDRAGDRAGGRPDAGGNGSRNDRSQAGDGSDGPAGDGGDDTATGEASGNTAPGGPSSGNQVQAAQAEVANSRRSRRRRGRDRGGDGTDGGGEPVDVEGFLDLVDDGWGFVRTQGWLPSAHDVYVSISQVRRFALRKGDYLKGASRPANSSERFPALLRIDTVNELTPEEAGARPRFDDLTPLFPSEKLKLTSGAATDDVTCRIVDLIAPVGKGQRGLIVSPPKAGKTTVMKQIATAIEANNPDVHLIVLLVDERPEEVTDMRRSISGEVIASTFDRPAAEHTQVAELAVERAKRLVEVGRDVVIILDGITRLARAYNLAAPASGRLLSGGLDSAALYPPKRFFGAARNIEDGGSLTILATALVDTGSKMDEVIFEEFKGTGNMELRLDRRLAERRIFPAIDVNASSTRHEELLYDDEAQVELVWRLRRALQSLADDGTAAKAVEMLLDGLKRSGNNAEFLALAAKSQSVPS